MLLYIVLSTDGTRTVLGVYSSEVDACMTLRRHPGAALETCQLNAETDAGAAPPRGSSTRLGARTD